MADEEVDFQIPDLKEKGEKFGIKIKIEDDDDGATLAQSIMKDAEAQGKQYNRNVVEFMQQELWDSGKYSVVVTYKGIHYHQITQRWRGSDLDYKKGNIPANETREAREDPTLYIEDPIAFLDALQDISEELYEKPNLLWNRRKEKTQTVDANVFDYIWFSAAPEDFYKPVEFLKRELEHIKDNTFEQWHGKWAKIKDIPSIGAGLFVQQEEALAEYETPYYLSFGLNSDPQATEPAVNLPVIRYGIATENGEKKAYLYSAQSIIVSAEDRKILDQGLEQDKEMARSDTMRVLAAYDEERHAFSQIFGEIPDEVLELREDPVKFLIKYNDYLTNDKFKDSSVRREIRAALRRLDPSTVSATLQKAIDTVNGLDTAIDLLTALQQEEESKRQTAEVTNKINKMLRGGVPPTRLVSIAAACHLFAEQGIHELYVPTNLPLRIYDHEKRFGEVEGAQVDDRIVFGIVQAFQRLEQDVDGIKIKQLPYDTTDKESFMIIQLGAGMGDPQLKSTNPLLNELVT